MAYYVPTFKACNVFVSFDVVYVHGQQFKVIFIKNDDIKKMV